jgi:hypothetical protein
MRSRVAAFAVLGVLAACAPSVALAAVLSSPAILPPAPSLVVPASVLSPALAPAALSPLFTAPFLAGPSLAPVPAAMAPAPALATPLAGLQGVAAALAVAAVPAKPQAAESALNAFWNGGAAPDGPLAPHVVDAIVVGGASPEFVAKVKAHLKASVPEPVLRDMLADGYRIEVNSRVRQGREDLHEDNDFTGGFHSYGPQGKFIVIAEKIKHIKSGEWRESVVWENAVNHEIGHAASYILGEREAQRLAPGDGEKKGQALWFATKGVSESPEFRAAWRRDYEAMPDALRREKLPDGRINSFYYFIHPDGNGWYQRARQETFAEGFDILLRGEASKFNHGNFTRHFPRALAEIRAALERAYGPLFAGR